MGKDECDVAIKNTTTIISIIDKKGAISKFEKSIFETMVEKIIAQKSVLTFVLINGVKLTIDAEE